jgi:hypothetical protein
MNIGAPRLPLRRTAELPPCHLRWQFMWDAFWFSHDSAQRLFFRGAQQAIDFANEAVVADHAGNFVPRALGRLGIPEALILSVSTDDLPRRLL